MYKRVIVLVLDSVGIGQAPDSYKFGDFGVNTLGNISNTEGLELNNLKKLGLGNISYLKTVAPSEKPTANFGKMQEVGDGKDTMTGHWEFMGCTLENGFKQYIKNGFPKELVKEFERLTNRKVIANKEANGMNVIREYYNEHINSGDFILYTSVDSTWQLAAHEEVIPLEELYKACEIARELTKNEKYNVARVIARPFLGELDNFYRTRNRKDYALDPFKETVLDKLVSSGHDSIAIGKIFDIFNGRGISKSIKTKSNMDGVDKTIEELNKDSNGLIFVNLVDFDSMYGHPRDVKGYKSALEEFDNRIPEILESLNDDDLLIITADHGNDPTYKGNDHTREYVPLLVYNNLLEGNNQINLRTSFEDIGETIVENFKLESTKNGKSFLKELR